MDGVIVVLKEHSIVIVTVALVLSSYRICITKVKGGSLEY